MNWAKTSLSKPFVHNFVYNKNVHCRTLFELANNSKHKNQPKTRTFNLGNDKFGTRKYSWRQPLQDNEKEDKNIHLMYYPDQILVPNIFKTIKNIMMTWLIIKRHFDSEFDLNSFLVGAKQAVIKVSNILAEGDAEKLRGFVTDDAIEEIKPNLARMTLKQKKELIVTEKDIYFAFIYLVGVMIDDLTEPQKRHVEITTCFHCVRVFDDENRFELNIEKLRKEKHRINIINYRFIREFTKGIDDDWTINKLDHFGPPNLS